MSEIQKLTPNLLWKWFDQICAIPHPSYQENALAEFIVNWAKGKAFYAERDEAGNVLIRKPATKGMENRRKVALQAHLDMVPQANEGSLHNFATDPIQPYIDGEWVRATNTTLGADNGIGMAATLAVLDSDDLPHPDLEVLLTMTEERGMEGAIGLRPNWLQSDIMINTDTEENAEIYVGCAGGENANISLPVEYENNRFAHSTQIVLKGLRGGHSGCDIHTGRANAIKLLARFLAKLAQNQPHFDFALSDIRGGSIRNAIPREAFATLNFNGDVDRLKSAVENFGVLLKTELALIEPNLSFELQPIDKPTKIFTPLTTEHIIHLLNVLPNGVIRNSDVLENIVETSLSVSVLETEENWIKATILVRSLIDSGKEYVAEMLKSLAQLSDAKAEFSGSYPGWEPQAHSPIVDLTYKIYAQVLGYEPAIKVIHAGLECGLLKKIYPNMDMVSIGPTIKNAHSPDEKVHIPAVQIFWSLITKLLAEIPVK
ncbi:Cytosol non-specific dipeptidase [Aggregatibacter actinomycetemcomitans]|uniref:aminoacyl-histidine dipeptidase n=1 Tax=Aggregatibacter actinomycetemcomitans TaxID=714 RepID=UPI0001B9F3B8|nr:aminoacyl-histidine dipeptidase [Aggregatibacter actinomycetemcomitans]ACX82131.1 aminoacyl-histidine dipeptidase [Aggregatibacter actinomycetemcomitans D11S-1]KOE59593.1 aminoacyl-histidine dipeptidase [Aggregatibacter actinomycetemcomitans serotype c str. SCC2302]KOE61358.1 aminoacyl-histidine dipeptidase [Aggregatibacter actinomycetemcomitans serotype c str. AAS4A]KOE63085.1 aminoacyl-histidine dipeptidase [Aggregatibacter actinomycetemcomitans serotype c str. D17P-2]KYK76236.1 aminoacyl